jgi:hypothetical protein
MDNEEIEKKATALVDKVEKAFDSDKAGREAYDALMHDLRFVSEADKIKILNRMEELNTRHRRMIHSLPKLEFATFTRADGLVEVIDVEMTRELSEGGSYLSQSRNIFERWWEKDAKESNNAWLMRDAEEEHKREKWQ